MARFTAITLDPQGSKTRRALCSLERIHSIVERSLGPMDGRNPDGARTQWRLDGDTLLVVSEGTPDERTLREQLDVLLFRTKTYDRLLDSLQTDTRWVFRCRANATVTVTGGDGRKSIVPLCGDDNLFEWLDRKGMECGFHVTRDRLDRREVTVRQERIRFHKHTGAVTLVSSTFDGVLSIDDPERFRRALVEGIGRAKAYGNGMITLARPKEYQR